MEIKLKQKYRVRKPTQQGYSRPSKGGNSGAGSVKRHKVNHNTCLARQGNAPGATLQDVGCPHDYRPEEHPRRYDALRGRYLTRSSGHLRVRLHADTTRMRQQLDTAAEAYHDLATAARRTTRSVETSKTRLELAKLKAELEMLEINRG